ncbi:MAG TPA: lytic murein transglycosylase B [Gammaproteobacteria bacterium]|nr:lytic murein transglycosylase B [Gammaproteobacteria bacterium]
MGHRMRFLGFIALLLGTSACSSLSATSERPGFANHPEAKAFIDEMVERHAMDRGELTELFAEAQVREDILSAISRPAEGKPWHEYRPIFLTRSRIDGGVAFWNEHADILARVEKAFGVDAQVIVAIIGVETRYGGNTGSYRVIDALSTLAFEYPPRAKFFRSELEQFLLLTKEERVDRREARGSYAGAMGHGQFISSSYRNFAVDFDGDGRRDLWDSREDIIASVANYLSVHGWQLGAPVAEQVEPKTRPAEELTGAGIKPSLTLDQLKAAGIQSRKADDDDTLATLIALEQQDGPEYWLGFNNFYVITRYNRSPLYAMAVYQLSEEIREARGR